MTLTRKDLLKKLKLKTETIEIDGEPVIVSEIGASDLINLYARDDIKTNDKFDIAKFYPVLVSYAVVDEKGNRIFEDKDIPELQKAGGIYNKISEPALRLNGFSGDELKNSEASLK